LSTGDGLKTIYLWGIGQTGQVTNSFRQSSITLDTAAPVVNLTSFTGGQLVAGGSINSISWTASDLNLTSNLVSIDLSADSGVTWSSVSSGLANQGFYLWMTPLATNGLTYRLRVTALDNAGNSSSSSSGADFTIDSTPPAITQTTIAASPYYFNGATVTWGGACEANDSMTVSGTDSAALTCTAGGTWSYTTAAQGSDGSYTYNFSIVDGAGNTNSVSRTWIRDTTLPTASSLVLAGGLATAAFPDVGFAISAADNLGVAELRLSENAVYANNNWLPYTATGTFTLSPTAGTKTVYAWVRDASGNVSAASVSDSIILDFGSPPTVSVTTPDGTVSFANGANVNVSWSCSGATGLDPLPVSIDYSTDDSATFVAAVANLPNNLTATTRSLNGVVPRGTGKVQL
jgi:hypothetical protein